MSELNTLCTKLGVKCFIDREYQFLHEYCTFKKPLTAALDILQGDRPYGTLLSTLQVLMQKTLAVKGSLSRMTAGLPDAIVQDPSGFCTALQSSTMVLSLPSSTAGFFVAVLRSACSVGASGPIVLLDSGSHHDVLPAVRLNSVSGRDDLRAACLTSGFPMGRPSGQVIHGKSYYHFYNLGYAQELCDR
ncbi:hypothetical protein CRENBAI_014347 [Crenichthys baileyi]|uniref:Uncharacterized protein n=1 Tax=Crenichthys baileyi TaxID=28760 RepID=A0AAV9S4Q1_9TELE